MYACMRARARPIHFYEQARQHKWPCMYYDRMRDVVRRRKGWKGKKRARERSKKENRESTSQAIVSFRVFDLSAVLIQQRNTKKKGKKFDQEKTQTEIWNFFFFSRGENDYPRRNENVLLRRFSLAIKSNCSLSKIISQILFEVHQVHRSLSNTDEE